MTVTIHPNGKIDGINNTNFNGSLSAGHVVQTVFVNYLNNNSSLVTEISSTSYTDIGVNIDITPKFANSILIARVSDNTVSHPFPPIPICAPHVANVNAGSSTVRVCGLPIARKGDSADAGAMTQGSSNVFSG